MAHSLGTALSTSGEMQRQQRHDSSPRRRRLYELIVGGFEHLLSQQGHTRIDGRGAGYVVWIPRREQYRHQQRQPQACDGDAEGKERSDGSPLVLYGGGYDGLFAVSAQFTRAQMKCLVIQCILTYTIHSTTLCS